MFATAVRSSKASRRALTSKKANKDFYKGAVLVLCN
jgi:large subunit ribosomal protein L41